MEWGHTHRFLVSRALPPRVQSENYRGNRWLRHVQQDSFLLLLLLSCHQLCRFTPPRPRPPAPRRPPVVIIMTFRWFVVVVVVQGPPPLYYHFDTLLMFSYRQMTHAPGQVAMDLTCRFKCSWCSWRREVQLCCCSYHQCLSFLSPPRFQSFVWCQYLSYSSQLSCVVPFLLHV